MKTKEFNDTLVSDMSKVYLLWLDREREDDGLASCSAEGDGLTVPRALRKKMLEMGTGVLIPDYLAAMITLGTTDNSGLALMVLADIINQCQPTKKPHVLTTGDFLKAFPDRFPCLDAYPDMMEKYQRAWLNQKLPDGGNMVDTKDFWDRLMSGEFKG